MAMTREKAREILRDMAGVDNYRARFSAFTNRDNVTASGVARKKAPYRPGEIRLKSGKEPTVEDIDRFMKMHGSNKKPKSAQPPGVAAPAPAASGTSSMRQLMEQLSQDYQSQLDAANYANEARYAEGHGELSGLRDRNQERVGNWGKAQEQLNEERSRDTLSAVQANLASRGLGNSTITDAFRQRNSRDLGLVQQDLSERRDDRASRYDSADTGNLVGFVERRTDQAPSMEPMLAMIKQLGEAEAYQQAQAGRQAEEARRAAAPRNRPAQQPAGISPQAAMAAMMQQFGQQRQGGRRRMAYGGNGAPTQPPPQMEEMPAGPTPWDRGLATVGRRLAREQRTAGHRADNIAMSQGALFTGWRDAAAQPKKSAQQIRQNMAIAKGMRAHEEAQRHRMAYGR
jgi:hypothetical protein